MLVNQVAEIRAKLQALDQQIAQQQGNLDAVQSTITKLTESMPYLEKRAEARESLADQGLSARSSILYTTQQDLVEHQQEFEVQQGRLAEAQGAVEALKEQRKQAEAEYRHKNLDDLDASRTESVEPA